MAERRPSIAELRVICQEHKWRNSRGLTRLNRHVSIYVTALIIRTRASANAITVASIGLGLAGAALFLSELSSIRLTGVGLLYLSFLFDQVDGEVARYWNATSLTGTFLDEIRHLVIYAVPAFAVGLRLVLDGATPLTAGAGFIAALSLSILRFNRNVRYLLVTKKLLAAANGSVQVTDHARRSRPRSRPRPASFTRRLTAVASRIYSWVVYVATNQVAILVLLLAFQMVVARVGPTHVAIYSYLAYSGVVTGILIADIFTVSGHRLDRSCAELLADLRHKGIVLPT